MERAGAGFLGHGKNSGLSTGSKLPEMNDNSNASDNECTVREQDRFMPIANVIRIMRKVLPPHGKISDDAKETIQECVSEFISFVTGEANERCQREQRKTITAEDVLYAMSKLGFDDYIEPLTLFLNRYRDLEGDRGNRAGDSLIKRSISVDYGSLGLGGYPHSFHHQVNVVHAHHNSAPPGFVFDASAVYGRDGSANEDAGEPPIPNGTE